MNELKANLIKKCNEFVEERFKTINEIVESNRKALLLEIKSSAGDKHETSRAIIQLEIEKASMQLPSIKKMSQALNRIDAESIHDTVRLGSIVITNQYNYFISISLGILTLDNHEYMMISPASPIGSLLLGKKVNHYIDFKGNKIVIEKVE